MASIYISYSRHEAAFAQRLAAELREAGHSASIDFDLQGGQDWETSILRIIQNADIFIVLISPDSLESQWVQREIAHADKLRKPIIPVLVEPAALPPSLSSLQVIDARGASDNLLFQLNRAIEALAAATPSAAKERTPTLVAPAVRPRAKSNPLVLLVVAVTIVGIALAGIFVILPLPETTSSPIPPPTATPDLTLMAGLKETAQEALGTTSVVESAASLTAQNITAIAVAIRATESRLTQIAQVTNAPTQTPTLAFSPTASPTPGQVEPGETETPVVVAQDVTPGQGGPQATQTAVQATLFAQATQILAGATQTAVAAASPITSPILPTTDIDQIVAATVVSIRATDNNELSMAEAEQVAAIIAKSTANSDRAPFLLITGLSLLLALACIAVVAFTMMTRGGVRFPQGRTGHARAALTTEETKAEPLPEEYEIFVSSSEADKVWVATFVKDLTDLNYLVWWYAKDAPGLPFGKEIKRGIYFTKVFIVVLSPDSMRSQHIEEEIRWADTYGRPIIPIEYRSTSIEERIYGLAKGADIDFTDPRQYKGAMEQLTQAINHYLKLRLQNVSGDSPAVSS